MAALTDLSFCHLVVGVTDMDRALAFYRDALGMDVVFETLISGEPFDAALHAKRQQEGRVVGGLLGGLMVELLSLGGKPATDKPARRGITGIQNISLSVVDLDERTAAYARPAIRRTRTPSRSAACECFSSKTRMEPRSNSSSCPAALRSTYEMHRGVPLRMGPAT